ncbi:N-acetylmuramoyl-L-alanine amidase [Lysinibacillus telephonicus]|uniref:N-acetylmuramoyl-L-alanine amidase n=1 Tax=Lysinibacillus telephonicus TaxID=1714840 RepID=UPI0031FD2B3F
MSLITISPGHYGIGTGARDIIDEVREARKVTNRIVEILKSEKIGVTKIEDNTSRTQSQNLNYLISRHNGTTRKVDVSIHFNASGERLNSAKGTEVLYLSDSNKNLAEKISKAISSASGLRNRGAKKRTDLAFLNRTLKPAILIEVCFVDSVTDVNLYQRYFEVICKAIANQLINYVLDGQSRPEEGENGLSLIANNGKINSAISSPTLIDVLNKVLKDQNSVKEIIEKGVSQKAISKEWLNKLNNKTLTTADLLGLSVLIVQRL